MNITLAFYGIPRYTPISAPSIEKNLLAPVAPARLGTVTVVYHLWRIDTDLEQAIRGRLGTGRGSLRLLQGIFGPGRSAAGLRIDQGIRVMEGPMGMRSAMTLRHCENLMHQLQSLKRVTEHVRSTDPDIVVFARPDLQYHDRIPSSARVASSPECRPIAPSRSGTGGEGSTIGSPYAGKSAFEAYGLRIGQAAAFARRTAGTRCIRKAC